MMTATWTAPRFALLCLSATVAAALWLAAAPAAAHEHYTTDPYEFTVGWSAEPAIVGAPNGLDVGIEIHGPANATDPVGGAEGDLTVTLMSGGQSAVKAIAPQDGRPGWYTFAFIPTRAGAYSVKVTGTLNGTAINFTAPLENAEAADEYQFPVADPTPSKLQEQLSDARAALAAEHANATAIAARVSALETAGPNSNSASSAASTAMLIGLLGLVAGVAGAALGAMAWRKGKASK
jgi:hypothetical protein